jgi:hypothetical protein
MSAENICVNDDGFHFQFNASFHQKVFNCLAHCRLTAVMFLVDEVSEYVVIYKYSDLNVLDIVYITTKV